MKDKNLQVTVNTHKKNIWWTLEQIEIFKLMVVLENYLKNIINNKLKLNRYIV